MDATVGLVAEVKDGEGRVALDPATVHTVVEAGARVLVETGAGRGAGFGDAAYRDAGAEIVDDPASAWAADLVVKVKEPVAEEYAYFRPGLRLFAFLHLAATPRLAAALVEHRVEAWAFETLTEGGRLPLLAPMSEIAGRTAAIAGAHHLSAAYGGSGSLLGGAAGVPAARVVVIGLGVAGTMAARGAAGLDAQVLGIDIDLQRLYDARLEDTVRTTLASSPRDVGLAVAEADLVIGAALVPGSRAPVVVTEEQVAAMRPGAVIVDLAIDQGGCVATSSPTSLSSPTYTVHDVVHYCVTNVPGQYPFTASRALSVAVGPRVVQLLRDPGHERLRGALNVSDGRIVHPAVAAALPDLPGPPA